MEKLNLWKIEYTHTFSPDGNARTVSYVYSEYIATPKTDTADITNLLIKEARYGHISIQRAEWLGEVSADVRILDGYLTDRIVDWLNSWEQLKGTAIALRFKEDFIGEPK